MRALPAFLRLPLGRLARTRPMLYEAVLDLRCGRREVLRRLFELVLIRAAPPNGGERLQDGWRGRLIRG